MRRNKERSRKQKSELQEVWEARDGNEALGCRVLQPPLARVMFQKTQTAEAAPVLLNYETVGISSVEWPRRRAGIADSAVPTSTAAA